MGRSLVRSCLNQRDFVVAVGRTFENTLASMQNWHENCLGLLYDVRARESVAEVIEMSTRHFNCVDVIANCSGYGVIGTCLISLLSKVRLFSLSFDFYINPFKSLTLIN
jgi:NAD(P)-dependent dehydrogenase (short-subunit alcohol dehydrogenase family)